MKSLLSSRLVANMLGASGARLVSMMVAVFSVPVLLHLIGKEHYGIWVTLTSLLVWFGMLDLGVGNSLRNSVAAMVNAEAVSAVQAEFLALFRLLGMVALIAALLLLMASMFFPLLVQNRMAALTLYVPALLLLPFLLGASVMQGGGKVGLHAVLQSSNSWLFFIFIASCHLLSLQPSLGVLALVWSAIFLFCTLGIFTCALRLLRLSPLLLLRREAEKVPVARLNVGLSFLVLQVSTLVLYSMGNLIIYSSLGAEEVARYDVLNKIFQIGLGFYTIVIAVMWAEISRLRALADFTALRIIYARMMGIALVFCAGAFMVAAMVPWLVHVWTAKIMSADLHEVFVMAALVSLQAVAYVGAVFLNAFEQVKIQVALALVSIALMWPLSHGLIAAGQGIAAVPMAAALLTLLPLLVCNVQACRILRRPAHAEENI